MLSIEKSICNQVSWTKLARNKYQKQKSAGNKVHEEYQFHEEKNQMYKSYE